MQPADHVQFGGAGGTGFRGFVKHLTEVVGIAARLSRFMAKGTEPALIDTEIGVVQMAVDVEKHPFTVFLFIDFRRQPANTEQVITVEQIQRILITDPLTTGDFLTHANNTFT